MTEPTSDFEDFADYAGDPKEKPTIPADDEIDDATPDVDEPPGHEPPD